MFVILKNVSIQIKRHFYERLQHTKNSVLIILLFFK